MRNRQGSDRSNDIGPALVGRQGPTRRELVRKVSETMAQSKRHMVRAGVLVAVALSPGASSPARACSLAGPFVHQVDSTLAATDTKPPSLTQKPTVEFHVYQSEAEGCGGVTSSCQGLTILYLHVAASDNQTPPERMGYRLAVASGQVPAGISLPDFDTGATNGVVSVPWDINRTGERFQFALSIAPIDEAGNVGESHTVLVRRDPQTACALAPGRATSRMAVVTLLVALALVLRRRRTSIRD